MLGLSHNSTKNNANKSHITRKQISYHTQTSLISHTNKSHITHKQVLYQTLLLSYKQISYHTQTQ